MACGKNARQVQWKSFRFRFEILFIWLFFFAFFLYLIVGQVVSIVNNRFYLFVLDLHTMRAAKLCWANITHYTYAPSAAEWERFMGTAREGVFWGRKGSAARGQTQNWPTDWLNRRKKRGGGWQMNQLEVNCWAICGAIRINRKKQRKSNISLSINMV